MFSVNIRATSLPDVISTQPLTSIAICFWLATGKNEIKARPFPPKAGSKDPLGKNCSNIFCKSLPKRAIPTTKVFPPSLGNAFIPKPAPVPVGAMAMPFTSKAESSSPFTVYRANSTSTPKLSNSTIAAPVSIIFPSDLAVTPNANAAQSNCVETFPSRPKLASIEPFGNRRIISSFPPAFG